jgi:hypothetical protein
MVGTDKTNGSSTKYIGTWAMRDSTSDRTPGVDCLAKLLGGPHVVPSPQACPRRTEVGPTPAPRAMRRT